MTLSSEARDGVALTASGTTGATDPARDATRSYHRPLEHYVEAPAAAGFLIERVREIPYANRRTGAEDVRAERRSDEEIPLFLAIRAVKPQLAAKYASP